MAYKEEVKFTKTNQYGCGPANEDDVYTRDEFNNHVINNSFIDYDGYGHPVKNKLSDDSVFIKPSTWPRCMPKDATHVVWYNR